MKTKSRYLIIILSLAIFAAMLVGISCAANESGEPTLNIASCNLSFRSNICIKYAVDTSNINTKLLVWETPQDEYVYGTQDTTLTTVGKMENGDKTYLVYDYTALSISEMTKDVYARAYLEADGVAKYGEVEKYSILQHAYSKLGKTGTASTNPNYIALLTEMLEFGAAAQRYDTENTAPLATDTFAQILLTAGSLPDGFDHGLYKEGTDVEITAPATDESGVTFTYWKDETGANVSSTATFTVTVGAAHKTYTPVYGEEPEVPSALEFESNGDGTCYVVGMGECTDSKIIIPATSPEGDTVKYIDRNAFADGSFTSIKIPSTVVEIGRNAFSGCSALTDVYYDGTEAEWANIDIISTGNTALTNATKHFKAEAVKTYTVTFKDYNGTILKTETVNQGTAATAPAAPIRDGYTFTGWDKPFTNITADTVVIAQYKLASTEPTIIVDSVTATAGESIEVAISVENSPSILSLLTRINYDSSVMTLKAVTNGTAMGKASFTEPSNKKSGCGASWTNNDPIVPSGQLCILTFDISASATAGKYEITVENDPLDTLDKDYGEVSFNSISGSVTVK